MGRRNRRRDDDTGLDEERLRWSLPVTQSGPDGDWTVRHLTGDGSTKTYRCPGCSQEIPPGVAHVVAYPADERGGVTDRRHWHTGCWQARQRRGPTGRR
jgi:hypothetical protein